MSFLFDTQWMKLPNSAHESWSIEYLQGLTQSADAVADVEAQ